MCGIENLVRVYGWQPILGDIHSEIELADMVADDRFPLAAMDRLVEVIGLGREARERILPRATANRLKQTTGLLPEAKAENVLHVGRAFAEAMVYFDFDIEQARMFWTSPHPELDHRTPEQVALTEPGAQAVKDVLADAAYGFPA